MRGSQGGENRREEVYDGRFLECKRGLRGEFGGERVVPVIGKH